jgi:diguanylate cyclase (GGDEF)-like protein
MEARLLSRHSSSEVLFNLRAIMRHLLRRYRTILWESVLLLALLIVATLIAYAYDIFPNPPGVSPQEHVIETDEAFALATLLCLGLLALSWRFLKLQRREVARRVAAERRAHELAMQDALTGLPNRRRFDRELQDAISAPPHSRGAHAVLLLDLNAFKRVNDLHGHGIGDEVLVNIAMRLRRAARQGDLVARFGGDEFAILARELPGSEDATNIALRIIKEIDQPIITGRLKHHLRVGVGIALFPQDGPSDLEIVRRADIALYRAKEEKPQSASRFFDAEMDARTQERDLIERDLRGAIIKGEVCPHYQPLIDLATKRVAGFEALARWQHPTLGGICPARFIPVAESCGLMNELTEHLLRQAARDATRWPDPLTLSFNISPSQLKERTLGLRILGILAEAGLSPRRLEIDLTESAIVHDLEGAQDALMALRGAGVHIALDDFGTGYSSLYHLRNFKIDKIKIDRSFVESMEREPEAYALVRALLGFGRGLGLTVTAEGVEKPAQAAALQQEGCQQGQGHLYGRAMPAKDAMVFIRENGGTSAAPAEANVA